MTQVRIHDDKNISTRRPCARDDCARKTKQRSGALDQTHLSGNGQGTNPFARAVGRAVIHEHDFIGCRIAASDAGQQRLDILDLVQRWDDERNHFEDASFPGDLKVDRTTLCGFSLIPR